MFRKDYALIQLVIGIMAVIIPVLGVFMMSPEETYAVRDLLIFSAAGVISGFIGGVVILSAYYKLTDKLKFEEYEEYKEFIEEREGEE